MENGSGSYRRFLDGDEEALVALIDEYKDGLILYLNSFVQNITLAEELAEDTFVRLAVKRPVDKGKGSFKTWLYTIGRNVAINELRRRARHREAPVEEFPPEETQALEESYIKEEQKLLLLRAMGELPADQRQALWLVYFEEMSARDAASVMKKSVHAVEMLLYHARQKLRSSLNREDFDL